MICSLSLTIDQMQARAYEKEAIDFGLGGQFCKVLHFSPSLTTGFSGISLYITEK